MTRRRGGEGKGVVLLLLVGLVSASCVGAEVTTTTTTTTTTTAPTTTTITTTTTTTTTTTVPFPAGELYAGVVDGHGGASIGDSFYPRLGNSGYDVVHVDLAIDFRELEEGRFGGLAILRFEAKEDLASMVVDTGTLQVVSVTADGEEVEYLTESSTETRIFVPVPAGGTEKIEITYEGVPEPIVDPAVPFTVGVQAAEDTWFAVSEPSGATTWFPANDHPLDKATYTISLTVAEGLTGIAGGVLDSTVDATGGGTTFTWRHDQPVASYLVPLAIGEFRRVDRDPVGEVAIRDYVDPDLAPSLLADLAEIGTILEWMIGVFGPYPFDSYGTLALDTEFGGALETQTLSTHDIWALRTTVIVHEAAHQWFGDSVSVADWSDIWLNEGFATYVQWLWAEHRSGRASYDAIAASGYEQYLVLRPPGNPAVDDLFNGGVYVGGASVLHALREEIGDEAFFALLRAWAQDNAHGNVTTEQFVEVASRFAGRSLEEFFTVWLAGNGG